MVELKVRKFGNSLGVILPKDVIRRLGATEGQTMLLTETPEGTFRLTPPNPEFEKKMNKAQDIMDRYRNTLRVLAK